MPVDTTDDKAESRLNNLIQHCVCHGAGCAYCSSGTRCLAQFQERLKDVMEARRRFRQQEKHIQEFQLLLMFQDQGKTMQNNAADPGAGEAEVTSSESGENVGEAEQTSDEEEQLTSVEAAAEAEQTSNSDDGEQEVHECRTSDEHRAGTAATEETTDTPGKRSCPLRMPFPGSFGVQIRAGSLDGRVEAHRAAREAWSSGPAPWPTGERRLGD